MLYRDRDDRNPDGIFVTGTPTLTLSIFQAERLSLFETESRFETELNISQLDTLVVSEARAEGIS
jgi:hypothetical protein